MTFLSIWTKGQDTTFFNQILLLFLIMELCTLKKFISIVVLVDYFGTKGINNVHCDSQSDINLYSDEDYYQLAAEYQQYQDDLPMPADARLEKSASKSIGE